MVNGMKFEQRIIMKRSQSILFIFLLCITVVACAQKTPVFEATPNSYAIDHEKNIIILNIDGMKPLVQEVTSLQFDDTYYANEPITKLQTTKTYTVKNTDKNYTLFVTKGPIMMIQVADSLEKNKKALASFRYYDADTTFTSTIGMGLRGNLSLTYPKKSFNIEFYSDSLTKGKRELAFKKLRKDDDWILDGLYNEPLLLRANTSQQLWKEIHKPSYQDKEPKARATVDGVYTDVFINNEYRGIYFLSEKINRSLLKLKKIKGDTVRGELFKAGYHRDGTGFKAAPDFKNSLPIWAGWEAKYPYEDYVAHYDNLHTAVSFIVNSTPEQFAYEINTYIDTNNAIDYFLFINLLRATDNLSKNYYIAKYNQETPYFMVPWDMDGVFGTIQDGKRISTTNDILSNGLFDKMHADKGLRAKMAIRWTQLRKGSFHTDSITNRITTKYAALETKNMYERDALVWNISHDEEHLTYMLEWIQQRLTYLDTYFTEE